MITIEPGNVRTQVIYDSARALRDLQRILDTGLVVDAPGGKYLFAYKSGLWDGKARLWLDCGASTPDAGAFWVRTGLVPRLVSMLELNKVEWRVGADLRGIDAPERFRTTNVPLRPYQRDAMLTALTNGGGDPFGWWPRGVLEVATGGGKTEIAVAMYETNPVPSFFLVHRKHLLRQAAERFRKYGHDVGIIGDGKFKPRGDINIATMQTLYKIFQDPESSRAGIVAALINDTEQVFFDECHLMASTIDKGNTFVAVADQFDAPYRWGLTATPFMRAQYDNLLLEGVTGTSLYKIGYPELVKLGFLTPIRVLVKHVPGDLGIKMDWKKGRSNKARAAHWRLVQTEGIKINTPRTELIVDEIEKGPWPLIILSNTIEQAEYIQHRYAHRGLGDLPLISGQDSSDDREAAIRQLEDGTLGALIATTIFDEGVDIPELRKLIFASGGKSAVKMVQRPGRGSRLADGKVETVIIDFNDKHDKKLNEHFKEREQVYNEQGFEVQYEGV